MILNPARIVIDAKGRLPAARNEQQSVGRETGELQTRRFEARADEYFAEEGLERRFARHRRQGRALLAGLETLGLRPFPQVDHRLPTLNCVSLPDGLGEAAMRRELLDEFHIEIGGGLGPLQGKVWRIGLMGESATRANVLTLLSALETLWLRRTLCARAGPALEAAAQCYAADGAG